MSFQLLPWEFPGAPAIPVFEATPTLKIGGKKRKFLLKSHEGRVYFKEPTRAQIYATGEQSQAQSEAELLAFWEQQMSAEDFVALACKRTYFPKTTVRGQFIFLVRHDGSALVQEHFDKKWFPLPRAVLAPELWNSGSVSDCIEYLLPLAQNKLLARTITPAIRAQDEPRFARGSRENFEQVLNAAAHLFVPVGAIGSGRVGEAMLFKSASGFQEGEIKSSVLSGLRAHSAFEKVWAILQRDCAWVGLDWHEGGETVMYSSLASRTDRFHESGLAQYGPNWRGNWGPQRARVEIKLEWPPSAHQRMEAALILNEFLRGKMPADEIETLLQSAV